MKDMYEAPMVQVFEKRFLGANKGNRKHLIRGVLAL